MDTTKHQKRHLYYSSNIFQRAAEASTPYQARGLTLTPPLTDETSTSNLNELVFRELACPEHGAVMEELSPRLFSFNSPYGACPHCHGLGSLRRFSPELVVPNLKRACICRDRTLVGKGQLLLPSLLYSVGQAYGFEIQTLWNQLTPEQQQIIWC